MKKFILTLTISMMAVVMFAQNITTASASFKSISEYYGTLKSYECEFEITVEKQETAGHLSYKSPDLLRMDYTSPVNQVICFNGDTITLYLSDVPVVLQQQVDSEGSGVSIATAHGLSLMSRYYTVRYENGQAAEPLENGSDEMVIKYVLDRKSASEAFRYIKVAVNESTKLIRRMEAVTPKGEILIFNFFDYKLNPDIPDQRFIYDPPSSANTINNFLFSE